MITTTIKQTVHWSTSLLRSNSEPLAAAAGARFDSISVFADLPLGLMAHDRESQARGITYLMDG